MRRNSRIVEIMSDGDFEMEMKAKRMNKPKMILNSHTEILGQHRGSNTIMVHDSIKITKKGFRWRLSRYLTYVFDLYAF